VATHYHIRWSTKEVLDWAPFGTQAEAEKPTRELVRSGETYTIEERDEGCPRCTKKFHYEPPNPNPKQEYPWQQAVRDAVETQCPPTNEKSRQGSEVHFSEAAETHPGRYG
jgi:hypothetical protein